ncbi:MAG: TolC family protein [Bacteroidota bacterium]
MNKNNLSICLVILLTVTIQGYAQKKLTLNSVIQLAVDQSPAALRAETIKENRYWIYRTFKSDYVPQLSLEGTLPDFNSRVRPVIQPDGSTEFVRVRNSNSDLTLSLSQAVPITGGRIFFNSTVNRFDDFDTDITRYAGDPAIVGFEQPLFAFNPLKWDKKIEPLRYEESKREYVEAIEEISQESSNRFFDLLSAQISLQIAEQNVANNDTIFKIAQGRYQLGKIPENDLLQLELNLMNSRQAVAQANLDLETSTLSLRAYLGLKEDDALELIVPAVIPEFEVDEAVALDEAKKNRQEAIAFQRRRLEAERDVAQANGDNGLNANLFANFGLTNNGNQFGDIYQNPQDQQRVRLGFAIPILDWGRQKSRVKTAQANQKLVQYTVQQEEVNFDQQVITQVKQFKMLKDQVAITQRADDISQRRYNIAKNRYLIGKISITDLSIALTEKDRAKRDYISSLGNFWAAYYELRRLTLFDFSQNLRLYKEEAVDDQYD